MQRFVEDIKKNALEYGSIPFWSWNDKLEEAELRRQINVMHDMGMKGFFMHARGGLETEYLSEEWYDCIRACVDEAKKLGMEAWSYDENGWPSGFAGGKLLKDKANWATCVKYETSNTWPEGEDILGVYVIVDGTCRRVTAAEEGVAEYGVVRQGWDESQIDALDADITRKFLQLTHEEYKEKVGFSDAMPGFFTDEPQYYRWATPWSNKMPAEFSNRYGYDVFENLAALFVDFEGAKEFRWDYYRLCHELFINNWIKVVYDWCEENGCKLTGHAVEESFLAGQMWCCGGIMPFYQYEHIPGIDYLGRNVASDIAPRQLGSACEQLGKKQALSEMFGCCGWDVSPNELKRITELQYVNGVNMMCQHLYPYSIRGQRKNDYPCHYSEHLPWQSAMKDFDNYFNNLGYIVSRGTEAARVLVIHPIHAAYLDYKRKEDEASIEKLQEDLYGLNSLLSENQIPYHFGDECMMADMASVEGSQMKVGLCTYDYVVVPVMETLDASTAALLKAYLENGGKVYLYGEVPSRIDGRKADLSWLTANCTFEEIRATAEAVIRKDDANVKQLRCMTRNTENGRIFFVTNLTGDLIKDVDITVHNCNGLYLLNLDTLEYQALCGCKSDNGDYTVTLTFEDSQSYVLVENAESSCCAEENICCAKKADCCAENRIPLNNGFTLTALPENMMTLDYAQISYDGVNYEKSRPIIQIKDLLLRAKYQGDLWLKFTFNIEEMPASLKVAAEPLTYRSVTVNGNAVSLDGDWWLDRSFVTADIAPFMQEGSNEIVMQINYFQQDYVYYVLYGGVSESLRNCLNFDTEIESIYLVGNFCVKTDKEKMQPDVNNSFCYDGTFALTAQKDEIDFSNIVMDGYPFFGGAIEAQTSYTYTQDAATELYVDGRYAVCDVTVNGEYAGRMMFKRHMDLSAFLKEGENTIALKIFNANRNLLGPHHFANPEPLAVGPTTFSLENMWEGEECEMFRERYAFVRFGIDCN
ncbi:MAG: hypothetical protein IKC46_09605 [Lachnospiraceae bacterium]|nr:hypothetical protein [Lachnospiraceae bacterium]